MLPHSKFDLPTLLTVGRLAEQEASRRSLHAFVRQAWPLLETQGPFKDGWHIRALCRHLEAVADGDIRDLLINLPPGCMKSLLAAVFWPCWVWRQRPWTRWLFASYSLELSVRDSQQRRKILGSPWYRRDWPWKLTAGENRRTRFHNSARGWMLATSVGGPGTGEHPDFIVVDDPHTAEQAESLAERSGVLRWWDNTISTRGIIRDVRRVVVMQRLHHDDLSGHLINAGGFTHVCLPMEYEGPGRMPPTPLGWRDERTVDGDLLWPAAFPREEVERLKQSMTLSLRAGQLQQRPPEQALGSEFPSEYFGESIWCDAWPPADRQLLRVMALDPSLGRGEASDYSAFVMLCLDPDGRLWADADLDRRDTSRLVTCAVELVREFRPLLFGVEANGFQLLLCDPLREAFSKAELAVETLPLFNTQTKLTRIRRLSEPLARGEIRFLRTPGGTLLVEQLRQFPEHRYDDGPDALESALRLISRLRSTGEGEIQIDRALG